jgi:hypothetical protein
LPAYRGQEFRRDFQISGIKTQHDRKYNKDHDNRLAERRDTVKHRAVRVFQVTVTLL